MLLIFPRPHPSSTRQHHFDFLTPSYYSLSSFTRKLLIFFCCPGGNFSTHLCWSSVIILNYYIDYNTIIVVTMTTAVFPGITLIQVPGWQCPQSSLFSGFMCGRRINICLTCQSSLLRGFYVVRAIWRLFVRFVCLLGLDKGKTVFSLDFHLLSVVKDRILNCYSPMLESDQLLTCSEDWWRTGVLLDPLVWFRGLKDRGKYVIPNISHPIGMLWLWCTITDQPSCSPAFLPSYYPDLLPSCHLDGIDSISL